VALTQLVWENEKLSCKQLQRYLRTALGSGSEKGKREGPRRLEGEKAVIRVSVSRKTW